MAVKFFTIGVYDTTHDSFFGALSAHKITHFCDIRQRRGLRGPKYKYANAKELEATLAKMGIEYRHITDLAPTTAIREKQFAADKEHGITGTSREEISPDFAAAYKKHILDKFDVSSFVETFPAGSKIVLFCVEHYAQACHRSLVAKVLAEHLKSKVIDITPML
jgi:uncharacterized protein (DUF488 family)